MGTRTPDPLLAKQMLSQLSYRPNTIRSLIVIASWVVGVPGLEPGTSILSGWRSNQLSYTPTLTANLGLLMCVLRRLHFDVSVEAWRSTIASVTMNVERDCKRAVTP